MDDGEVALLDRVNYNVPSPFGYAEGYHRSLFSCMREEHYLRKASFVSRLQRGRASRDPTDQGADPHAPSWGIQLVVCIVVSLALASCMPHAQIVNETATGGTVLYSYIEEQDVLTSPERTDALRLLDEKCPAGYRISREGEVPRVDQAVDRAWMGQLSRDGQVSREKRWAIQFACK